MNVSEKRRINSDDLYHLIDVNNPAISPNGQKFVFVETIMDKDENEYHSHLFIGDLESSKIAQWTFGNVHDTSPRFSPDGEKIAFVSNRSGHSQIYVMSLNGGEPKQVTYCPNGAKNPIWSPDGTTVLFTFSLGKGESITDEEKKKKDSGEKKIEPMVVEKLSYKSDSMGFRDDMYSHLAIVQLETGEIGQLTDGDNDHIAGCWSNDGDFITFTADLSAESDYNLTSDIYLLTLKDKKIQKLTNSNGFFSSPTASPNGKYLGFLGDEKEYLGATLTKIWLYNLETNELRCLNPFLDVQVGDSVIGDFHSGGQEPGLSWTDDSYGFYFLGTVNGSTVVYYGSIDGTMYPVLDDVQHVYGLAVNGINHTAVVAISKPAEPGDLYFVQFMTGEKKQLTRVNDEFLRRIEVAKAETFSFKATDGLDIQGWIMKPAGFKEEEKYPLVLEIHGGPHAMYANTYFHEFQVLAASGFAVLYTNPRGSHGYGQEFVNAVRGDYGGKDYLDLMCAVDYAIETFDFIDSDKLGVTGGSYGGFMTNWVVGHTDRFKAAVTQRSISNWLSFYGVSDIGYFFIEWEVEGNILENADKLWNHSPLKYVGNVSTPLLLIHGEKDFRCPIEQAEQFFVALKAQKKTAKFLRFPDANHELSRSGNPAQRIIRLTAIKDWFIDYLLEK